jgi:hypothetical protein
MSGYMERRRTRKKGLKNRTSVSYETVSAIKKHVETHRQRASCRDELVMTGDDGMIEENRRWWP